MGVFLASVKEAVAVHGLRSAAACVAAAMLGPASMVCGFVADGVSTNTTTGEIPLKSGAETLPGALWSATARGEHTWIEARVRAFNRFWDAVGWDRLGGAPALDLIGRSRPMRIVADMPEYAAGTHVYKIELGTGLVSDALLNSLMRSVTGAVANAAADGDASKAAAITSFAVKLGLGSTLESSMFVSTTGEVGIKARSEVKVGARQYKMYGVTPGRLGGTVWVYINGIAMDDIGTKRVLEWVAVQARVAPDSLLLAKNSELRDCELLGVVAVKCGEDVVKTVMMQHDGWSSPHRRFRGGR